MNLMTMQFGSFVFPVNPTELKLERACLLRETVGVDGEERVEAVGKRRARVVGTGHFTGENAMAVYRELEALFGVRLCGDDGEKRSGLRPDIPREGGREPVGLRVFYGRFD